MWREVVLKTQTPAQYAYPSESVDAQYATMINSRRQRLPLRTLEQPLRWMERGSAATGSWRGVPRAHIIELKITNK
jgi:hypothetical protein